MTDDDYPAAALRAGEQGTVEFQLDVDVKGGVTGCQVTKSSGSAALDSETCTFFSRMRFSPAKDADGKKIPGTFSSRMNWKLPGNANR